MTERVGIRKGTIGDRGSNLFFLWSQSRSPGRSVGHTDRPGDGKEGLSSFQQQRLRPSVFKDSLAEVLGVFISSADFEDVNHRLLFGAHVVIGFVAIIHREPFSTEAGRNIESSQNILIVERQVQRSFL